MTGEGHDTGGRRRRSVGWATVVLLGGGLLMAACSSSSSSTTTTTGASSPATSSASSATTAAGSATTAPAGSTAALRTVVAGISKSAGSSFSATYTVDDATTGQHQTVTFAQSPPRSAVVTPSGSFYIDGTSVTECEGSGAAAKCTTLSTSLGASLSAVTDLFSPGVLTKTLTGIEAEAEAHIAGVTVSTSSATYAGLDSTCATLKDAGHPQPVTYCAANSSGILTYSSAGGSTVTLTAFTANPPASTFAPPAGSTVVTLPSGT